MTLPRIACLLLLSSATASAQTRGNKVQATLSEDPNAKWWQVMDTGPFLSDTFRIFGGQGEIGVLKGIAIKVGENENHSVVFDTETMRMVAGIEGTVTLAGTPWDGKHGGNSYLTGDHSKYFFATHAGPGWAIDGNWSDPRDLDNGKPNGPLPDEHAEYLGLYRHADATVLHYTVGGTEILEWPRALGGVVIRTFELGETEKSLQLLAADPIVGPEKGAQPHEIEVSVRGPVGVALRTLEGGRQVVDIPSGTKGRIDLIYSRSGQMIPVFEAVSLRAFTGGGPALFPETVEVAGRPGESEGAYAVDTIPLPTENPWKSNIRFGAFDFFPDGDRVACSTWNGDVWIAEGISDGMEKVTWRRFASGLYQTLGLRIVDGVIYTMGRDQLTRLHDLNDDGEADYYECFNNDVNITEGFHEFAFDLQTDEAGNFYFSKGQPVLAGGRGFAPWTEHNGTILKVSPDGEKLERIAWGLRAPGGLGLGPNGELTTGENEGSYVPRCKITWSQRPDLGRGEDISFHGVVPAEWEEKSFIRTLEGAPTDYERPLCWLPYYVDNSSGSQFWVPEGSAWKNHAGQMLHLSYGKSTVYRALIDEVDGQVQGGVYRLPIDLTTAVMRGRFHPKTGELYLIGFRGWQTNGGTGFHRVRLVGEEKPVPLSLEAHENGIKIGFSAPLDPEVASDPRRYAVSKWDYIWGPQYGSGRFSIDDRDDEARALALTEPSKGSQNQIDTVTVRAASVLDGGMGVFLYMPEMTPAMQMEIKMDLAAADGEGFRETIWNTIHLLRPGFDGHGLDLTNLPEIDTDPIGNPGLILSMAHGSTDDAVVLDRLALTLDPGQAATPFIDPRRGREMVFEGSVLFDARGTFGLKLDGTGWASLKLDGETVLEGDLPLTVDAIELEAGPHTLFANFRRNEDGSGRIQFLWSGEDFVWESVPPKQFRYLPNDLLEAKDKTRHGRNLFAAAQCVRCHESEAKHFSEKSAMPELLEGLPDFSGIGHRLHPGWIEQWVRQPEDHCPSVAPDSAADIAAWFASQPWAVPAIAIPEGDPAKGEELAKALHLGPWVEELAAERKHTDSGLIDFLQQPEQHHADTTFPNLHLDLKEAAHLAAWIQSKQPDEAKLTPGDPDKGKLMVEKRCLVCHEPDQEKRPSYESAAKPLAEMWEEEWLLTGCLSTEEADQPELGLSLEEKQALLAFRNVDSGHGLRSLSRFVPHEYAARTMERLSCTECHSGENSLPDITLAGEKLRDDWLAGLLHGDVLRIRPYQEARMPEFSSRADALAKGIAHRAGVTTGEKLTAPDPPLADAGAKIAGLTGYACSTCHAVGATPALQAFEGQGPNLQLAGERLREDYYHAWMHWPQRYVPTTIMPKYTADKNTALNPSFFEGNARKQFEALWQWMRTLEGAEKAPVVEGH